MRADPSPPDPVAPELSPGVVAATRLSIAFVLDIAKLSRRDGDLIEPLVFAAIVQANQAALRQEPALRRRLGETGDALPDDLRRPISIHAIAQSLDLPFETVRRRVRAMLAAKLCISTPEGLYVPQSVIASPWHAALQLARLRRLNAFRAALAVAPDLSLPCSGPPVPARLMRPANRYISEYVLRSCMQVRRLADGVQEAVVLLGLCDLNGRGGRWPAAAPRDHEPCSLRALGHHLDMPRETLRRRLSTLTGAGLVRSTPDGLVVAAPGWAQPRIRQLVVDNLRDLRRLLTQVADLSAAPG